MAKRPRKVDAEAMIAEPPEEIVTESGARIAVTGQIREAEMAPGFVNAETEAGLMFFPPQTTIKVAGRRQPAPVDDEESDED